MTALAQPSSWSTVRRTYDAAGNEDTGSDDMDEDINYTGSLGQIPQAHPDDINTQQSPRGGQNHDRDLAEVGDSEMEGAEDTAGASPSDASDEVATPRETSSWAPGANAPISSDVTHETAPGWVAPPLVLQPLVNEPEDELDQLPSGDSRDDQSASSDDDEDPEDSRGFYPFREDTTSPQADELCILDRTKELSALDDTHWKRQTFFDVPGYTGSFGGPGVSGGSGVSFGETGVIEWSIDRFNGTADSPNKALVMRSSTVCIGGNKWRIKVMPHGNKHTDRVSAYVENVDLASSDECWENEELPLPGLGDTTILKPATTTAQISVLLYNPEDPRVYDFKADGHQFTKHSPDHGWPRFTMSPWYDLHRRQHLQRQPLLRNDKLAVKAFVRIVHDPTRCLWRATINGPILSSMTSVGLVPLPYVGTTTDVLGLWLHLKPFRQLLYQLGACLAPSSEGVLPTLLGLVYQMRTRQPIDPRNIALLHETLMPGKASTRDESGLYDPVRTMHELITAILEEAKQMKSGSGSVDASAAARIEEIFRPGASFSPGRTTQLSIANHSNIQSIIDANPGRLERPELLTIELERQVFDKEKLLWKKLLTKVELSDQVSVGGTEYVLYGLVVHKGHIQSEVYQSYFRPAGPKGLWYIYNKQSAECVSHAKAVLSHEGSTGCLEFPRGQLDSSDHSFRSRGQDEVAYVVLYVRSDAAATALDPSAEESWDVPQWIIDRYQPKTPNASATTTSQGLPAPDRLTNGPYNAIAHGRDAMAEPAPATSDDNASAAPPQAPPSSHSEDVSMPDTPETSTAVAAAAAAAPLEHLTLSYFSQPHYSGTARHGLFHGTGTHISMLGDLYTGTFQHGARHGPGSMAYANGDTYAGSWAAGQRAGHGTHTDAGSGNVYTGNWREGKRHGAGTTVWRVSDEDRRLCRVCFEGEADAAFYDCGHVVCCRACAARVDDCPVCRRRVRDVVKLYYGS